MNAAQKEELRVCALSKCKHLFEFLIKVEKVFISYNSFDKANCYKAFKEAGITEQELMFYCYNKTVVYFVGPKEVNRVKIGYTCDLNTRIGGLQTGSPLLLDIHATIFGNEALEKYLHKYLSVYNSHGEWFEIEGKVLAVLNAAKEGGLAAVYEVIKSDIG